MKYLKIFIVVLLLNFLADAIRIYVDVPRMTIVAGAGALYYSNDFFKKKCIISKLDKFSLVSLYALTIVPVIYTKL